MEETNKEYAKLHNLIIAESCIDGLDWKTIINICRLLEYRNKIIRDGKDELNMESIYQAVNYINSDIKKLLGL